MGLNRRRRNIARTVDGALIDGISLDPGSSIPLHRQLYNSLRDMILRGVLPGEARMPSSRVLSGMLGVSRFTTVTALDQLTAEGYLRTAHGSGTFVVSMSDSVELAGISAAKNNDRKSPGSAGTNISKRAKALMWRGSVSNNRHARYLHMSAPDHRLFPAQIWSKLTREVLTGMDTRVAYYRVSDEPSLLEQTIASQVAVSRGIDCSPENVVSTLGAHHAVHLLADLLLDPGDFVAFEEPGMSAVRSIFQSHGCKVMPMQVDSLGANPGTLPEVAPKLAFVTAAKQQPLTIAMPASRKLELLNWAARNNTVVVEDDLGSEFRYEGRPIPPLKAMDRQDQVIYVGAFSMSLLQTMRVGYLIMPKELATHCRRLLQVQFRALPQITEQILARFIKDGHYSRHLHKMRRIYAKRQDKLQDILNTQFGDIFYAPSRAAGFYNMCYFSDENIDDTAVLTLCNERGLGLEQLSYYYQSGQSPRKALLVGFAASNEAEIEAGASLLRECVQQAEIKGKSS